MARQHVTQIDDGVAFHIGHVAEDAGFIGGDANPLDVVPVGSLVSLLWRDQRTDRYQMPLLRSFGYAVIFPF